MGELFNRFHATRRNRRRFWLSILIFSSTVLFLFLVFFVKRHEQKSLSYSQVEPDSCVRLHEVSGVYRIRSERNRGRIWFATAQGLYELDTLRNQWQRFGPDQGLGSDKVYDVAFIDEIPWAVTRRGCNRYNAKRGRFEMVAPGSKLDRAPLILIEEMEPEGVFFGVDGGELYRLASLQAKPERIPIPDGNDDARITCLKKIGEMLYIGIENGWLYAYDPRNGSFHRYVFGRPLSPHAYLWDVVLFKGNLWVATSENGLYRQEQTGEDTLKPVKGFPAKGAFAFALEEDGFWCGTPFGLWRYHARQDAWIQFVHPREKQPTDFQVLTLFNEKDRLWFGSLENGCGYLNKRNLEWVTAFPSLSRPNAAALAADDSLVWVGFGYQGGFTNAYSSDALQKIKAYEASDDILEQSIQCFTLSNHRLFYGGYEGFGYLNMATGEYDHYSARRFPEIADITDIAVSPSQGLYYLAGAFGVVAYYADKDSLASFSETRRYRTTALYAEGDTLWAGTLSHGVLVIDRKSGQLLARMDGVSSRVMGLFGRPDNPDLLLATKEKGCYRLQKSTLRMESVDIPDKVLPGGCQQYENNIMTAKGMGNLFWVGTRFRGAVVYDENIRQWKRVTSQQGLLGNQIRAFAQSDRYIWIGTYGGVTRFHKPYLSRLLDIVL